MPYQPIDEKEVYQKKAGRRGQDKKERKKRKPITEATKAKRKENLEKKKKLVADVKALYVEKGYDPTEIKRLLKPDVRHKKGQGKTKVRQETHLEKLERLRRELTGEPEPSLPEFKDRPGKKRKKVTASKGKGKKRRLKRILSSHDSEFGEDWKVVSDKSSKGSKESKRSKTKKKRKRIPFSEGGSGMYSLGGGGEENPGGADLPSVPSYHPLSVGPVIPASPARKKHQSIIPSSPTRSLIPIHPSIFEDPQGLDVAESIGDAKASIEEVIEAQSTDGKSLMDKIEEVKKGVHSKEQKIKKCNELLKICEANRLKEQKLALKAKKKTERVFNELNILQSDLSETQEESKSFKDELIRQSERAREEKKKADRAKAEAEDCEKKLLDKNKDVSKLRKDLEDEYDNARDCKNELERVENQVQQKNQQLYRCEEQLGRLKAVERIKKKLS